MAQKWFPEKPQPSELSLRQIHDYAGQLLDSYPKYLMRETVGKEDWWVDGFGLASHLGAKFRLRRVTDDPKGHLLTIFSENEMDIAFEGSSDNRLDRYEAAIALGHYFLHYHPQEKNELESNETVNFSLCGMGMLASEQVRTFAYSLLMPELPFMESLLVVANQNHATKFFALDRQFKVRPGMARLRYDLLESLKG